MKNNFFTDAQNAEPQSQESLKTMHKSLQAIDEDISKRVTFLQNRFKKLESNRVMPDQKLLSLLYVRKKQQAYVRNELAKIEMQLPDEMLQTSKKYP